MLRLGIVGMRCMNIEYTLPPPPPHPARSPPSLLVGPLVRMQYPALFHLGPVPPRHETIQRLDDPPVPLTRYRAYVFADRPCPRFPRRPSFRILPAGVVAQGCPRPPRNGDAVCG